MLLFWLPALLVFVADRLSKLQVMHTMAVGESHRVLGEFFRITSVRNTGAAFGLFAGNPRVFLWVSLVAIALVLVLYWRSGRGHRLRSLALGLILGGAFGNVYDRFRYHEVVDFLEFTFGRYHFAVFNVADSAVTVGVALLAIETWLHGSHPSPQEIPGAAQPPGDGGS
jgi:signal peptidase II